jgi:hypothetical protein
MPNKKNEKLQHLTRLSEQLNQVRQQSLAASRRGDFRAMARLTCEAARLNREILLAEGPQVPVLATINDEFFVSARREPEPLFGREPEREVELVEQVG